MGLVLLCVDPHALRVKMTGNHDRVRKLFAIGKPELKNLTFSTDGLTSRIENSADELRTSEDPPPFAASRANDLRLTEPRRATRLDVKHRDKRVERYFPHASHQVIILSTDTEIERHYFESLQPFIARAYHLDYDDKNKRTVAEEGYFF